jgi:hypothetical protein
VPPPPPPPPPPPSGSGVGGGPNVVTGERPQYNPPPPTPSGSGVGGEPNVVTGERPQYNPPPPTPSGSGVGGGPNVVTGPRPQDIPPLTPWPLPVPPPLPPLPTPPPPLPPSSPPTAPPTNPFRGVYNAPPPPPSPPPNIIKTPERFLSIFQEDISAQSLERLLFENIGGIELANIIRHDTVEGTNLYYKIISNLSRLKVQIDPITLIARQRSGLTPQDFGKQISLFTKLPSYINFRPPRPGFAPAPTIIVPFPTYLENPSILDYIFIDGNENSSTYGNLIVELINIAEDEFLEVEIASSGTIYEVEQ